MDFKFGRYIHRVHRNKSPLNIKFWRKGSVGVSRDCPNVFDYPPIISGTGKPMDFEFGRYIHRVHANKGPLKIFKKREHGHIQGLPNVFKYPILSQERTSNLAGTFAVSILANKRSLKILEKGPKGSVGAILSMVPRRQSLGGPRMQAWRACPNNSSEHHA